MRRSQLYKECKTGIPCGTSKGLKEKAWKKARVTVAQWQEERWDCKRVRGPSSQVYEDHRTEFDSHLILILTKWGAIGCLLMLDAFWSSKSKCVILEADKPMLLLYSFCLQVTSQLWMSNCLQNEHLVTVLEKDIRLRSKVSAFISSTDYCATLSKFLALSGPQFLNLENYMFGSDAVFIMTFYWNWRNHVQNDLSREECICSRIGTIQGQWLQIYLDQGAQIQLPEIWFSISWLCIGFDLQEVLSVDGSQQLQTSVC